MNTRKTIRFEGPDEHGTGAVTLALQAAPPHAVLVRLEEPNGLRPAFHLEPEHVRMLVQFLKGDFLEKIQ